MRKGGGKISELKPKEETIDSIRRDATNPQLRCPKPL